jgi:hypothetical protein
MEKSTRKLGANKAMMNYNKHERTMIWRTPSPPIGNGGPHRARKAVGQVVSQASRAIVFNAGRAKVAIEDVRFYRAERLIVLTNNLHDAF